MVGNARSDDSAAYNSNRRTIHVTLSLRLLMSELPLARENHRDVMLVRRGDHV